MIKSLRLENFQSHKDSTFEFSPNLSVIVGSSNQGKTSIVRAFSLLLYNQWDSSWTRVGASFCRITLMMDSGILVVREKGTKINKYILKVPNQVDQIYENFGINVPEVISKVLNIRKIELDKDDSLALNMSFQLDNLFMFNRSGAQKAKVLGRLSGAHFLDHALRSLSTERKQLSTEKNLKEKELEELTVQYAVLNAVSGFRPKIEELEIKNATLDAARQRVEALKSLLGRVQDWKRRYETETQKESILDTTKTVEIGPVESSIQRLKELKVMLSQQQSLSTKIKILNDAKNQFEIDLQKETQTYLTTLSVNKVCPTCFNTLDNQKLDEIKNNLIGKRKMPYLIITLLAAALIYFLPKYFKLTKNFDSKLTQYKETELQKKMYEYDESMKIHLEKAIKDNVAASTQTAMGMVTDWKVKYEEATRQDAINKSQSIMMGKTLEHLIPYFPEFRYNPRDARFLGSPTDLIVFDGLSEGKLRQIVFVEIKTNTSQLNEREKQIRDIVGKGLVKWDEIRHEVNRIVKP